MTESDGKPATGGPVDRLRVGLTGAPGSGKTTVARRLAGRGVPVIDMDLAGRWAIESAPGVRRQIRDVFGDRAFTAGGEIDRRALGALVFSDAALRLQLNRIVHPPMLARVRELMALARNDPSPWPYLIIDSALIFELDFRRDLDLVVVVCAPLESRLARSARQRGLAREEILRRTLAQWPQEEKEEAADYVLRNERGLDDLDVKIDILHNWLLTRARRRSSL